MILSVALSFARDRSLGNARRLLKSSILYLPLLLFFIIVDAGVEAVHGLMIKTLEKVPFLRLVIRRRPTTPHKGIQERAADSGNPRTQRSFAPHYARDSTVDVLGGDAFGRAAGSLWRGTGGPCPGPEHLCPGVCTGSRHFTSCGFRAGDHGRDVRR